MTFTKPLDTDDLPDSVADASTPGYSAEAKLNQDNVAAKLADIEADIEDEVYNLGGTNDVGTIGLRLGALAASAGTANISGLAMLGEVAKQLGERRSNDEQKYLEDSQEILKRVQKAKEQGIDDAEEAFDTGRSNKTYSQAEWEDTTFEVTGGTQMIGSEIDELLSTFGDPKKRKAYKKQYMQATGVDEKTAEEDISKTDRYLQALKNKKTGQPYNPEDLELGNDPGVKRNVEYANQSLERDNKKAGNDFVLSEETETKLKNNYASWQGFKMNGGNAQSFDSNPQIETFEVIEDSTGVISNNKRIESSQDEIGKIGTHTSFSSSLDNNPPFGSAPDLTKSFSDAQLKGNAKPPQPKPEDKLEVASATTASQQAGMGYL